jgi:hypothetical protein
MKTAAKVVVGVGVAASMIGLAVLLGKPKTAGAKEGAIGAPCPPGLVPNPARLTVSLQITDLQARMPAQSAAQRLTTSLQITSLRVKLKSMPTCVPMGMEGGGFDAPAYVDPRPYRLIPEATGDTLEILNARAMLDWLNKLAKQTKVKNYTDTKLALQKFAPLLSPKPLLAIAVTQLPELGVIKWPDLLNMAKGIPWMTVKPLAAAWLKDKGL